ncbi:putative manganese-dependent inorganic diphosphatase [Oribacterium sp. HCP28S3_H8]|jgi:manganese-dependent inorganic pyrophosphatase|uniref:putative manganese-dependent inorganic diphosphatase n=1 Tax=Oribacterium sp. HCP28S3_H8 TaxID=3438945 RepID=UPI003F8C685E
MPDSVKEKKAMHNTEREILITGHRNPDTDSICAAISYARLKNKINATDRYVACRAGNPNAETSFVLEHFKVAAPRLIRSVRTQVSDVEYRKTPGVDQNMSLKQAWNIMNNEHIYTLPTVSGSGNLNGLITLGDIAKSYMNVYDSSIISKAHTQYKNILETLEATLVTGDVSRFCTEGKVLIAAANPEMMSYYIDKHDIVILGNRAESQLSALDNGADCIIICEGANVSPTIKALAEQNGMIIMVTSYDAYTAARLINQSMPIKYFMTKDKLVTFSEEDAIDDIRDIMTSMRHRDFPVLSKDGKYLGMISRRNLLGAHGKQVILVDHNEAGQAVEGVEKADIREIIDHHKIDAVPTMSPVYFRNQPLGCCSTIIYQMYKENGVKPDPETAGLLMSAIISDTLLFRSPTCTEVDKAAGRELAEIAGVDIEKYALEMFAAASNLKGKTDSEIFHQDFKKFTAGKVHFGVSQVTSLNADELDQLKPRLISYAQKALTEEGIDMSFIMLTNILNQDTILISVGAGSGQLVENAFAVHCDHEIGDPEDPTDDSWTVRLPGVVSRKKQLVPPLTMFAEQL